MTDNKNMENTAFYKLSTCKGFEWFKHIILVSSFQDQYSSYDSARIQIVSDAMKDQKKGNIWIKMVNNLLGKCN